MVECASADGRIGYVRAVSAVAAAALIAGEAPDPNVAAWWTDLAVDASPELVGFALEALERAHSEGSELHELNRESGVEGEAWTALDPAIRALRSTGVVEQEGLF
nr:DUF4259 domain-containing protein [Actinocorallia herbida]